MFEVWGLPVKGDAGQGYIAPNTMKGILDLYGGYSSGLLQMHQYTSVSSLWPEKVDSDLCSGRKRMNFRNAANHWIVLTVLAAGTEEDVTLYFGEQKERASVVSQKETSPKGRRVSGINPLTGYDYMILVLLNYCQLINMMCKLYGKECHLIYRWIQPILGSKAKGMAPLLLVEYA